MVIIEYIYRLGIGHFIYLILGHNYMDKQTQQSQEMNQEQHNLLNMLGDSNVTLF